MKRIVPLLCLLLLALAGCQTLSERRQEDALTRTLRSFENTVRWDRLAAAWSFLTPEAQQQGGGPPADLDNLRVISYDLVEPPISPSEGVVMQRVQIRYVHQDRQVVRTLDDPQRWEHDPETQSWRRANPMPVFR
jgi:hypothetical protein